MAKKKKFITRKGMPTTSVHSTSHHSALRVHNAGHSEHIAYKLSTDDYYNAFFPSLNQAGIDLLGNHIGFQFLFRIPNSNNSFNNFEAITPFLVFFNPTSPIPFKRIRMINPSGPSFVYLEDEKAHHIDNYTENFTFSHNDISNECIPNTAKAYEKLDFFPDDKNIDFVYFTVDQIKHLFNFYKYIVISGSQINFGKKLSHRSGEKQKNYNDLYFTLKMEGLQFNDYVENKITTTINESAESHELAQIATVGSEVVIGQPCPPFWFSFSVVHKQVFGIDKKSALDILKLMEDWRQIDDSLRKLAYFSKLFNPINKK